MSHNFKNHISSAELNFTFLCGRHHWLLSSVSTFPFRLCTWVHWEYKIALPLNNCFLPLQRATLKSSEKALKMPYWVSMKILAKGYPPFLSGLGRFVFSFLFHDNAIEQISCSFQVQFFFSEETKKTALLLDMWSLQRMGCGLVQGACSHHRPSFPRCCNLYQRVRFV